MVRIRPSSLALLILALLLPEGAAADTRIIVKRDSGLTAVERADIRADAGVELLRTLRLRDTEVVTADRATTALRSLRRDDDVVYAELDRRRRATGEDEYMDWLWGLHNVGQPVPFYDDGNGVWTTQSGTNDADIDGVAAWGLATGLGAKVAVVDTGIDVGHEDLAEDNIETYNFVGTHGADAVDGNGHGTHVTGTLAAVRDNDTGVAGVAPDATVLALRALDDDGGGWDSDIAEAFRYAGDEGARVVNASLGGAGSSATLEAAIAAYPSTLFVVAAGNGGADHIGDDNDVAPQWPCNVPQPNVLCVGASTSGDARAPFSNYGDHSVDVFAPGDQIFSTYPTALIPQGYAFMDGTSMASPHVAGAAALVLEADPDLSAEELKELLLETADAKPAFAGYSVSASRLNAEAAVQFALAGATPPDGDGDGVANAADACPTVSAPGTVDGCPPDTDRDGVPNSADNCDFHHNANQADADHDGVGDACDTTPRGPDADGDGWPALDDDCPTRFGTGARGCPTVVTGGDRDRDGHIDASDGCPNEPAATRNGCPLPAVTSLSARSRRRTATVRVRTSRAAMVRITIQRKKGRRWVRVARRRLATTRNRVTYTSKRLRRGRYRAVIVVSSSAGRARRATKTFRVR